MRVEKPLWTNAEQFEALQNTNQGVNTLIQKVKLGVDVRSHGSSLSVLHFSLTCTLDCKLLPSSDNFPSHLRGRHGTNVLRTVFVFWLYGGDSATGSGGVRAGNCGRVKSCAPNGKWITSLPAIVAPPVRLWSGARWC